MIVLCSVADGMWYGVQRKRGQCDYCMGFGGLVLCHYLCCTTVIIAEHIRSRICVLVTGDARGRPMTITGLFIIIIKQFG